MTEQQRLPADELGDATDDLVAAFGAVLGASPRQRAETLADFRQILSHWQEILINRCSAQASGFVPMLSEKIDRLCGDKG